MQLQLQLHTMYALFVCIANNNCLTKCARTFERHKRLVRAVRREDSGTALEEGKRGNKERRERAGQRPLNNHNESKRPRANGGGQVKQKQYTKRSSQIVISETFSLRFVLQIAKAAAAAAATVAAAQHQQQQQQLPQKLHPGNLPQDVADATRSAHCAALRNAEFQKPQYNQLN